MKLQDPNLQAYKKNYFTYPPSGLLLSFSKNARSSCPKVFRKIDVFINFAKFTVIFL